MNAETMTSICRHADGVWSQVTSKPRLGSLISQRQLTAIALVSVLFPGIALAGTWVSSVLPMGLFGAIIWGLGLLVAGFALDTEHRGQLVSLLAIGLLTMLLAMVGFSVASEFTILAVWLLAGTVAIAGANAWLRPANPTR